MARRRVLYYAHDYGSGHMRHAVNVAGNPHLEVLVVSSSTSPADAPFEFISLDSDIVDFYEQPDSHPFHYVPIGADNVKRRFVQLHDAMTDFAPDVVLSDVSAEVAAFAKLCGYPTIVRRMHGSRHDHAHIDMYELADQIVAYYPQQLEEHEFLERYRHKTTYAGMLKPPEYETTTVTGGSRKVVVLTSLGGDGVDLSAVATAASQTPEWQWTILGRVRGQNAGNVEVLGVVDDPAPYLLSADMIIASAGHNAVRAAAAADRPTLLFPEPRMYEEQETFAAALAGVSDVRVISSWNQDWQSLLDQAQDQNPRRLSDSLFVDAVAFNGAIEAAIDHVLT